MKLCRFGESGSEKPGVVLTEGSEQIRIDVSSFGEDYDEHFFGSDGIRRLGEWLEGRVTTCPRVSSDIRHAPPLCRPSKIICVGLNYREHAAETGSEAPTEPLLFGKATTAMCGCNDSIVLPRDSKKTDWEVELAVVIGRQTAYVPESDAARYIAGFTIMNDVSERAFQKERGGQFIKGKSCDTFAPFGPYIATPEEVRHPQRLRLWLDLNGERCQDGTTADMIFSVQFLVSYISGFMTLLPGDVISTGTPSGVGAGRKPPLFLKSGDLLEYGIEGLGSCRNTVVAHR